MEERAQPRAELRPLAKESSVVLLSDEGDGTGPQVGEQPPEVVAWVREVRVCSRGDTTGIDPTEDAPETGAKDVRDV